MLRDASEVVGARWVVDYSAVVEESGRRVEGGWPGTLPEARARVLACLPKELAALGFAPLSPPEIALASSMASAEAKRRWQLATKRRSRTAPTTDL